MMTDDVREALILRLRGAHEFTPGLRTLLRETADYLAAFEVRPLGPVPAEPMDAVLADLQSGALKGGA